MRYLFVIFLLITGISLKAQKVTGIVKSEKGEILPFTSVLLKGTTKGASANDHGRFSFEVGPGRHTIICRRVGYKTEERTVDVAGADVNIDFTLAEQQLELANVIVKTGGEDPAYAIIRKAIKARKDNAAEFDKLRFDFYSKDLIKLRSVPKSVFGKKIIEEDKKDMGLDSAGKGVVYLSENISSVDIQKPNEAKINVISSRVSGSNGFGFTMPISINLYQNNVIVFTTQLNPRGFISPIADGALNYYRFKFLGTFYENGQEINSIEVTPKRQNEPLFSGIINIMEDSWRIFSTKLMLTKKQQLELIDTLTLNQEYVAVVGEKWRIKNQHVSFAAKLFGFDMVGNFLNVYSNYDPEPVFKKDNFNKVVMEYDTAATKRPPAYWDSIRPVPLEMEEALDYKVKDSTFKADSALRNTKAYRDSMNRLYNKFKPTSVLMGGYNFRNFKGTGGYSFRIDPLLSNMEYNTVEGLVMNVSGNLNLYSKKGTISLEPNLRYGFSSEKFYGWLSGRKNFRRNGDETGRSYLEMSGGKRVTEFNKESQLSPVINNFSTLFWGKNYLKIYENYFASAGFFKEFNNGLKLKGFMLYEDRKPLENTSDYVFIKRNKDKLTANYPVERIPAQFVAHQAVNINVGLSFQTGQRYIKFPNRLQRIGSDKPVYSLWYSKGIKDVFGSDVNYDKWMASVTDGINMRMAGVLKYKVSVGGFLNNKAVPIQDYQHFNGNQTLLASDYLNSFQLAPYYANSTTEKLYGVGHVEHHFNGLLTNKIPLFNRLKWNLVAGSNAFYVNEQNNYVEVFAGLENIFKILRADVVFAYVNGTKGQVGVRLGFGGIVNSVSVSGGGRLLSKFPGNFPVARF